jgi:hypothetical protein
MGCEQCFVASVARTVLARDARPNLIETAMTAVEAAAEAAVGWWLPAADFAAQKTGTRLAMVAQRVLAQMVVAEAVAAVEELFPAGAWPADAGQHPVKDYRNGVPGHAHIRSYIASRLSRSSLKTSKRL